MAQSEINSLFTNGGLPATNIGTITPGFPTVRVWEVDGNTQTLIIGANAGVGQPTDGIMTEITTGSPANSDGFYTFLFSDIIGYNQNKKYLIRTDGGPSLTTVDRYQTGEIEPSVLDEILVPDHQIPGSAGETLSDIKSDTGNLLINIADVDVLVKLLIKYETGRTKIDEVANTLTIYDTDCVTPLRVFQLLDQNGVPSTDSVCERKPISGTDGVPVCT